MAKKRVLFVEDNLAAQRAFDKAVGWWNRANEGAGRSFEIDLHDNYSAAKEALSLHAFDCALFDLHLPTGEGVDDADQDTKGSRLAELSLTENSLPVAIISALPDDKDPELDRFKMLRVFGKSERYVYRKAIEWLGDQWQLMEAVEATRKKIRETGAEVFVSQVWPRFESWQDMDGVDGEELTRIVTRQYVTHITELLSLSGEPKANWHPFESYIIPPMRGDPYTGDIFDFDGSLWVVLTPPCDMAQCKIKNVVLAHCDKSEIDGWANNLERLRNGVDENQKEKGASFFRRYVNQNVDPSCHFLPPLNDEMPILVRFTTLITKKVEELEANKGNRIGSVSGPFLVNLTQRFGSYMSRTGQPDINVRFFA